MSWNEKSSAKFLGNLKTLIFAFFHDRRGESSTRPPANGHNHPYIYTYIYIHIDLVWLVGIFLKHCSRNCFFGIMVEASVARKVLL